MLVPFTHDHSTRGRDAGNLVHQKPRKDIRKFSFPAVAPRIWDEVDDEARNATTVNGFKNAYDRSRKFTNEAQRRTSLF